MDSLDECGWVPIERTEDNIRFRVSKDFSSVINRNQFPFDTSFGMLSAKNARTHPGKSSDEF